MPSQLANWKVIEIFDTEVPNDVLKAIDKEQNDSLGYVYALMWKDAMFYHGEDGWCLSDSTLVTAERWLEEQRLAHGLAEDGCFWFRVKRS